ncbi:MAG: branched-chain amino acid transport system substrate-binding protein, partial [Alphaproteobacteria bacterium]|nr:branched-chain amino acid transport system substrate-binding protein [Alphaproteobacteria bacterium]
TQQLEALTTLQCRTAAKYTKEHYPNVKRLSVLYVNYEYGIEVRDQCEIEFGKVGVELVASEAHPNAPSDLRAQTTKLLESKPDAIYLGAIGGGTIPLGIRAGRELGYKGVYITSTSGDTPDVYNFKLAEKDFFFTSHAVPDRAPQVVKDNTKALGAYVGAGYDFGWLVSKFAKQLVEQEKPVTGKAISDALRAEGRIETPVNTYIFKQDGDTVRPLAIFGVADGGRKLLQEYSVTDIEN